MDLQIATDSEHRTAFVVPGEDENYENWRGSHNTDLFSHRGKLLRLSGWINMESRLSVGCAGAVLTYLSRRKAAEFLPGDANARNAFQIAAIETFSLKENMCCNSFSNSIIVPAN